MFGHHTVIMTTTVQWSPRACQAQLRKPCAYLPMPQNEVSHFLTPLLRKMSHAFQRSLKRENVCNKVKPATEFVLCP